MGFELSSHEVMRGIRVRDGSLVLRPSGLVMAGTIGDGVLGAALTAGALVGGGSWLVLLPLGAWLLVDGLARLRVAVVASPEHIRLTNRWRTHHILLHEVSAVRIEQVEWLLRSPAYIGRRTSFWAAEWQVGEIVTTRGIRHRCEAVISEPGADDERQLDPTPAEMKVEALRRWIGEHRADTVGADGSDA